MANILVYYFAFPHYRAEILKELNRQCGDGIAFAGGTIGRDHIKPLTNDDIDFLEELESVSIGVFGWQKGIMPRAISRDVDAVVVGPATLSLSTWAILIIRRVLGRRTYLWGQCGRYAERSPKRLMQELMNRLAHGLLVYGHSEAAAASELGTSSCKVHIVNNATHSNEKYLAPDLGERAFRRMQLRTSEAIEGGRLILTFVGRLTEAKRLEVLFQATRNLRSRYSDLRVRVVGGGSAEGQLKEEFPDPFIEYVGWVYDNEDLNEILEDSTLIVSPYHMGLLAVDALRAGIPVLVPDNPRNGPEVECLTEDVNSIRFVPGDHTAIVDAVDRWLTISAGITAAHYTQARELGLRTWSPSSVASKLLGVVNHNPDRL